MVDGVTNDRNNRTEAILRWAFTGFVAIVVVGWLVWRWMT